MPRCTLTSIALAAKVSVSTVSYALRNDPKIPLATSRRIQELARAMGYRPNPAVSALMAHIKSARLPKAREKLAFVWVEQRRENSNPAFDHACLRGARGRAEELGYGLEVFHLEDSLCPAPRLSDILIARGIRGVVFCVASGFVMEDEVRLAMKWPSFSCSIIGSSRWKPPLHRAGYHHFMGVRRIMLELTGRNYTRPAAILNPDINTRANHTQEAAFLTFHPDPDHARDLLLFSSEHAREAGRLARWLRDRRPDALLVTHLQDVAPLRSICAAARVKPGFVVASLDEPGSGYAGVDPGHEQVASNAIDLVLGALYRNEQGVPAEPKEMLFAGHWVEGSTLRPRPATAVKPALR